MQQRIPHSPQSHWRGVYRIRLCIEVAGKAPSCVELLASLKRIVNQICPERSCTRSFKVALMTDQGSGCYSSPVERDQVSLKNNTAKAASCGDLEGT